MRVREGDSMSDVRVVDIGVCEDARLRTEPLDEPRELFLRKNRDSFGIQFPREGRGILPSLDPGNLRGGERDDAVRRIVPEINVEIMEVAARGAEDDDPARLRHGSGSRRGCKAFLDFPPSSGMLTLNKVNFPTCARLSSVVRRTDRLRGFEDSIQHRLRETAGLRVALARMVRCDQRNRWQEPGPSVAELRHGRWKVVTRRAPRAQERLHRHGPEDDDYPEAPQEYHLAFQIRLASGELDPRRLVLWRGAPHRRGDVAVPEDQTVVLRNGSRLIREAGAVQGPIQEFSAPVSRECAPGSVASMGRRRQADDQDLRVRIPEPGDGPTPVFPIPERGAFHSGDALAVSHEPRTPAARDDLRDYLFQVIGRHRASGFGPAAKACARGNH